MKCKECGHDIEEHASVQMVVGQPISYYGQCHVLIDSGCGDDEHCPPVWCYCDLFEVDYEEKTKMEYQC